LTTGSGPPKRRLSPRDVGACEAAAGGRENSTRECTDGVDNDCNGFIDCEDFGCRNCGVSACVRDGGVLQRDGGFCMCASERSATACADGNDNDCDGFVDCMDNDCAADMSCQCQSKNETCDDTLDNDCDALIDLDDSEDCVVGTGG